MAYVYRKTYARRLTDLPADTRVVTHKDGRRYATWRDAHSAKRTAPVTKDGTAVLIEAQTYTAKFRTAHHRVLTVPTGCRDKEAAKAFLADLVRREELVKLLDAARRRPLTEALTVRRGERKGELAADVRADVRERLEALGRERALIYATLFATGLWKGELTSLTVGRCILDGPRPCLCLRGADAKNGKDAVLPLRADVARELRHTGLPTA